MRRVKIKPLPLETLSLGPQSENEFSARSQSQTLETLRKMESMLVSVNYNYLKRVALETS